MDLHTHSSESMEIAGPVSLKRPRSAARGGAMTIPLSSLHPRRALPVGEILKSHSVQGKMGAAPVRPRNHRNSGIGMVR